MNQPIIFTRYLYIKDEVETALKLSLINQEKSCLFWAYELYYSGFQQDLFDLLWKIFEEHYSVLNPNFKKYFTKKQKEWENSLNTPEKDDVIVVGNIVYNLMRRTTATPNGHKTQPAVMKKEKRLYVVLNEEELSVYKTIVPTKEIRNWQILKKALVHSTNESSSLHLFPLNRKTLSYEELTNLYWYHWEYFASFSPVWKERIDKYGGVLNHDERKVVFEDDDMLEEFYSKYGYEPDEQPREIREKNIPLIM